MIHLASLRTLYRLWRQRTRERRLAAEFTDRDLWDVGLTRGDIYREFARPFWRGDGTHGNVRTDAIGAMTCSRPMKAAATAAR
jgi:uncharacterized protein YjiS (DUF1127 family)